MMNEVECTGCGKMIPVEKISALLKEEDKMLIWCNTCYKKGLPQKKREEIKAIKDEQEKARNN